MIIRKIEETINKEIPKINSQLEHIEEETKIVDDLKSTGIQIRRIRDTEIGTTYVLTKIPYMNTDGTINKIKKAFHSDSNPTILGFPANLAIKNKAIFACNASAVNNSKLLGLQIKDGIAVDNSYLQIIPNSYTAGFKNDGTLKLYPNTMTQQELIDDGVVNSFCFTCPLILNGEIREDLMSSYSNYNSYNPRQVIAQDADKNTYIFTSEGRREEEAGFTLLQIAEILKNNYSCINAYNLDGGGSAQTVWEGALVNTPTDVSLGMVERNTPDILYVSKEIQEVKQEEKMRLNTLINRKFMAIINEIKKYGVKKCVIDNAFSIISKHEEGQSLINIFVNKLHASGHGIQIWVNNTVKLKLGLHPDHIRYSNYETGKVIFSAYDDGRIVTQKGTIGQVMTISKTINDVHELNEVGFYWCNVSSQNIPPTSDGDTAWSLVVGGNRLSNYLVVTATGWRTGNVYHKHYDSNGWSSWTKI